MLKKIVNIISTVVLILLVLLVVFVFITRAVNQVPSIFGYSIFRVSSDSMEPELMVGDVILVKSVKPEAIHQGDIITYLGNSGDLKDKMITHKVIREPYEKFGVYYYQTQGVREGSLPDPEITYDQIKGKFIRTLPFIDRMYAFFLSPVGLISFIALILVLFAYEMISLIVSYKSLDEHDDDYYEPKSKKKSKKRKKGK